MEIPTDKIIEAIGHEPDQDHPAEAIDRDEIIKLIKAQALEIRELQAVIVRLRSQ